MLHSLPVNQIPPPRMHNPQASLPDASIYVPSFPMGSFRLAKPGRTNKVVIVMGATGTGKSKLTIDLARMLGSQVINSDKMQLYASLDVVTNKVTEEECMGVPHHLINGVHPDADFSASEFRELATRAVDSIADKGLLPIIASGSNSYIEELVDGANEQFRSRYKCCFLWVDVQLSVLHDFVSDRVDRMIERGLVEEVRALFDPNADYSKGLRQAVGVPELDAYLRSEGILDESERARLLKNAIDEIKANMCKLTCRQLNKICRLAGKPGWNVQRIKATEVFRERGEAAEKAWDTLVAEPGVHMVRRFLWGEEVRCNFARVMEIASAAGKNMSVASAHVKSLSVVEPPSNGDRSIDLLNENGGMSMRS